MNSHIQFQIDAVPSIQLASNKRLVRFMVNPPKPRLPGSSLFSRSISNLVEVSRAPNPSGQSQPNQLHYTTSDSASTTLLWVMKNWSVCDIDVKRM